MGKLNNSTSFIVLAIIGVSVLIIVMIFKFIDSSVEVKASLSKNSLLVGEQFEYSDSTAGASTWFWEFGNDDVSQKREGEYTYKKAGVYKVRLTVNGNSEKIFNITVKENQEELNSHLIQIIAPDAAMQGELIVFRGVGDDKQWKWEFGESGIVDSREKDAIYSYTQPGSYQITLFTENTKYPITHIIEIYPQYSQSDSTDVMSVIGADIKEKLQNIADRKSFNTNYKYIVNKYLGNNENTEVFINNAKYNDIYSYCQGLRMADKSSVTIEQVIVEIANLDTGIVTKIMVIQKDKH